MNTNASSQLLDLLRSMSEQQGTVHIGEHTLIMRVITVQETLALQEGVTEGPMIH